MFVDLKDINQVSAFREIKIMKNQNGSIIVLRFDDFPVLKRIFDLHPPGFLMGICVKFSAYDFLRERGSFSELGLLEIRLYEADKCRSNVTCHSVVRDEDHIPKYYPLHGNTLRTRQVKRHTVASEK